MCRKAEVVVQGAGAGSHWCLGRRRGPLGAPSPVSWILEKDHQTAELRFHEPRVSYYVWQLRFLIWEALF